MRGYEAKSILWLYNPYLCVAVVLSIELTALVFANVRASVRSIPWSVRTAGVKVVCDMGV